jgi:hypothetical protein
MRPMLILATLALAAVAQSVPVAGLHAQTTDKDDRCRGPDGKDATAAACKGAGPAPAVISLYRLDSKGQCRDAKGRLVKAEKCGGVEDAPAKAAAAQAKKTP